MISYTHVMIALDQSDDGVRVADRGFAVARQFGAKISVLHVVDQRALEAGGEALVPLFGVEDRPVAGLQTITDPQPVPISGDERPIAAARRFVESVANHLGQANIDKHVVASSSIASAIVEMACRCGVDLLIVGAHHRHGLALFLPSAVDGVVHHLPCDVLLVRLSS